MAGEPRAVVDDEAEAAARDLIVRYPDVHDGWDRLGMVHEARGETREAAATPAARVCRGRPTLQPYRSCSGPRHHAIKQRERP
jgi:hypothetical protein